MKGADEEWEYAVTLSPSSASLKETEFSALTSNALALKGKSWQIWLLAGDETQICLTLAVADRLPNTGFQVGDFFRAQDEVRGGDILFQSPQALGSGNRHDVVSFVQEPGQSNLSRSDVLLAGQVLDSLNQFGIPGKICSLETRISMAEVVRRQILDGLDFTRQETASERTVGHKTNPQFADGGQDVGLWPALP